MISKIFVSDIINEEREKVFSTRDEDRKYNTCFGKNLFLQKREKKKIVYMKSASIRRVF